MTHTRPTTNFWIIRLLVAIVLASIVVWWFWVGIWHTPTWGQQHDPNFQPPPWGQWQSRDRLILTYGISLWFSAFISAYFAPLSLGRTNPQPESSRHRSRFRANGSLLGPVGSLGILFAVLLGVFLLAFLGVALIIPLAVLFGANRLFGWLRQESEMSGFSLFESPWTWTFSFLSLVGVYGMFAPLLLPLLIISTILFGYQLMQRSLYRYHWLVLPMNIVWLLISCQYSSDWFGIYGD